MNRRALRYHLLFAIFGLVMGFCLYWIGFADYDEVHRLFIMEDLRLLFTFAGAVVLAGVGFATLARHQSLPPKPLHKGTIPGGILFGIGWAITGACPSIAMVQLGVGKLPALVTIAGIIIGVWIFRNLRARFFNWDTGACDI